MGPELVFIGSHMEIYGTLSKTYGASMGLYRFPYGTQWEGIWGLMGQIGFLSPPAKIPSKAYGARLVFIGPHVKTYGIPSNPYGAKMGSHRFPYGTQWEGIWGLMGQIGFLSPPAKNPFKTYGARAGFYELPCGNLWDPFPSLWGQGGFAWVPIWNPMGKHLEPYGRNKVLKPSCKNPFQSQWGQNGFL